MKTKHLVYLLLAFLLSCSKPPNNATTGALTGGALGAGVGAIIGSQSGRAGVGTAIGAAAGALGGALIGNQADTQEEANQNLEGQIARTNEQIQENQRLIDELRSRGADARSSRRGVVVNLPDVLFEFDRSALTPEARRIIGEVADVVKDTGNRRIAVEGHTDSIGTVVYNKRLSLSRASSTRDELVYLGIPSSRMRVEGFGEGSPVASNNTDEGRARNRRVEVIIEN